MPMDSKVARMVRALMRKGKSKAQAIRIAQARTGQSYKTGRKSKSGRSK
jgi:hypothetical protein